jgi:SAM-dependent methyltransferase
MTDDVERLLAEQIRYYEDRAPEYEDLWFRRGTYDRGPERNTAWFAETAIVEAAVDAFDATGDVLEVACGSGLWTRRLAPRARRLVAVDSSPAMLELNRSRFGRPNVEYVHADAFDWEPGERFDAAVAGFFVSHVPPDRFERFWRQLASWLRPDGQVFIVDELPGQDRAEERTAEEAPGFTQRRTLPGDRVYEIVKIYYSPDAIVRALDAVGWVAEIRRTDASFFYGIARPADVAVTGSRRS